MKMAKRPGSPQHGLSQPGPDLNLTPIFRADYRPDRPEKFPPRLPTSQSELELGKLINDRFLSNCKLYMMGRSYEDGVSHDIWVVLNCNKHPIVDAIIHVNPKTGYAIVRNADEEDMFEAALGTLEVVGHRAISLYFIGGKNAFATVAADGKIVDLGHRNDCMNITDYDKKRIDISLQREEEQKPCTAIYIYQQSPTVLAGQWINLTIVEPIKRATAVMCMLKAGYNLFDLALLPYPRDILYLQQPSTILPATTASIMSYILSSLQTVRIRPALTNCKDMCWYDLIDEDKNILLTLQFLDFSSKEQHGGALEFRDNYGVPQIAMTGLGSSRTLEMTVSDKCGINLSGGNTKFGSVKPGAYAAFYDKNGAEVMYESAINPAKNFVDFKEHLPGSAVKYRFEGNIPTNHEISITNGLYKVADILYEPSTTKICFIPDLTLKNDLKVLILGHAWKIAHHIHELARLAPRICSKEYGYRETGQTPSAPMRPIVDLTSAIQRFKIK